MIQLLIGDANSSEPFITLSVTSSGTTKLKGSTAHIPEILPNVELNKPAILAELKHLVSRVILPFGEIGRAAVWIEEIVLYVRNERVIMAAPCWQALIDGCADGNEMEVVPPGRYRCRGQRLTLKKPTHELIMTLGLLSKRRYLIERVTLAYCIEAKSINDAENRAAFLWSRAIPKNQAYFRKPADLAARIRQLEGNSADMPVSLSVAVDQESPIFHNPAVVVSMTFRDYAAITSAGLSKFGDIDRAIVKNSLKGFWQREMLLIKSVFKSPDDTIQLISKNLDMDSLSICDPDEIDMGVREIVERLTAPMPDNPHEQHITAPQRLALHLKYLHSFKQIKRFDNRWVLPTMQIDNKDFFPDGAYGRPEVEEDHLG